MKQLQQIPILFITLALLATGCRSLDPDGPYQGDEVAYNTELTIVTSKNLIDLFVSWEKDNREPLRQWPQIKQYADFVRANAKDWFATANAAYDTYKANPTAENADKVKTALAVLKTALKEATRYIAEASNS